jgi:hypothetical protein
MGYVYALTVAPLKFAGSFYEDYPPVFDSNRIVQALQPFHYFGVVELGVQRYANQICFDGEIPQPHWIVRAILPLHDCDIPKEVAQRCSKLFKRGALPEGQVVQCSASLICPESAASWLYGYMTNSVAEYHPTRGFVHALTGFHGTPNYDLSLPGPHTRRPLSKSFRKDVRKIIDNYKGSRIISAGHGNDVADLIRRYLA